MEWIILLLSVVVLLLCSIAFKIKDLRDAIHRWHKLELESDKRLLEEYKIFNAAMKKQQAGRK